MIDFEKYLKRYIWDHDKTPYLVSTEKLHRRQAEYEILAYALLVGFFFGLLSIFSLFSIDGNRIIERRRRRNCRQT